MGVSFSNGRIAIVRMCAGRPPPANPYRVTHADASRSSVNAARKLEETPDRGVDRRDGIGSLDDKRQGAAGGLVSILHRLVGRALDPFLKATTIHPFEAHERIAPKRGAPVNWCPNVGPKHSRVNADYGVCLGRDVQATERRPEQRARRDKATTRLRPRHLKGIADENGRTAADPTAEKEIQPNAVGRRDSRDPVAARVHISVVELPLEDDLAIAS